MLQRNITVWFPTVTHGVTQIHQLQMAPEYPQVIPLYYQTSHYLTIVSQGQYNTLPSCVSTQPVGSHHPRTTPDDTLRIAASHTLHQELNVEWNTNPYATSAAHEVTYTQVRMRAVNNKGWQEIYDHECRLSTADARSLCQQRLACYSEQGSTPSNVALTQLTEPDNTPPGPAASSAPSRARLTHAPLPPSPPKTKAAVRKEKHRLKVQALRTTNQYDVSGQDGALEQLMDKDNSNLQTKTGCEYRSIEAYIRAPAVVHNPIILTTANLRSSQEGYKIDHLSVRLNHINPSTTVIALLQETWLRSEKGRQEIIHMYENGWIRARLDRSRPDEPRSGGLVTMIRPPKTIQSEQCQYVVRHTIVDTLGAIRTDIHKETLVDKESQQTKRILSETLAIFNIYVPTGKNQLTKTREEDFVRRIENAVKNASQHTSKVVIAGDWNHLTNTWEHMFSAQGFRTLARYGVEILMAKIQAGTTSGGYSTDVTHPDHELFTDHPILYGEIPAIVNVEAIENDIPPDRTIIQAHAEEFTEILETKYGEAAPALEHMTTTEQMRWATQTIKEAGQALTRKYKRKAGAKYMFYPKKISKMHDKLRGRIPLEPGESKNQLRRRVIKATSIWKHRMMEKASLKRDALYDTYQKRVFRLLKGAFGGSLRVIECAAEKAECTSYDDRDSVLHRVIGSIWSSKPGMANDLAANKEWQPFAAPDQRDLLTHVGGPATTEEITQAFAHMSTGKSTHSDAISKELLTLAPDEIKKLFHRYIKEVFRTGHTDIEEGDTEVVLLIKKLDKSANEVTNKRPISLIRFTTKWVQTILAYRIQSTVQHLDNYGFQKQKHTQAATRKVTAILEYGRLHRIPAHMVTVDIEKAYDTVPYELIEYMLKQHQCPEHIRRLIRNAHVKRTIRFKIDGKPGSPLTPLRGVAQGSPLSCILFVLCMQPLLRRLQTVPGIFSPHDDTAYVDDLTLLTQTAANMERKWGIVQDFEQWTGMKVNVNKCEYDTTEADTNKWAHLPGVQMVGKDDLGRKDAVRILGYWLNTAGDHKSQLEKIATSIESTVRMMRRKLMSPEICKGVINMILNMRLNYIAQLNEIPEQYLKRITKSVKDFVRSQFGIANPTATDKFFLPQTQGGLGVEDPVNVATRAYIEEYMLAINSGREELTARIMRANQDKLEQIACGNKQLLTHTDKAAHTQQCRRINQDQRYCTCGTLNPQNTMYAQMIRTLRKIGWTLQSTASRETSTKAIIEQRLRDIGNGKNHIARNELIWASKHDSNGEASEAYLISWTGYVQDAQGKQWGTAHWCPAVAYQGRNKPTDTIFGPVIAAAPKLPPEVATSYITNTNFRAVREEMKQLGILNTLKYRLSEQFNLPSSTLDIVGIDSTWKFDPTQWLFQRAHCCEEDITIKLDAHRHKARKIRTRVIRLVHTGYIIDVGTSQAAKDKKQLKTWLRDPVIREIHITTDGARVRQDPSPSSTKHLGSGIYAQVTLPTGEQQNLTLAWYVTGVTDIMGAELAPIAKVLQWSEPTKIIHVRTDSQASIDAINKLKSNTYRERDILTHAERNPLRIIHQEFIKFPSKIQNLKLDKAISHIGEDDNEIADIAAGLGARRTHHYHMQLRDQLPYVLVDNHGQIVRGRCRKIIKFLNINKISQDITTHATQGRFWRIWRDTGHNRTPSTLRQVMASNK